MNIDDDIDTIVETRDVFPSHFMCKIGNFSLISECEGNKYESAEFETGGYKWKLMIYPNGRDQSKKDYVSVYLAVANSNSLPARWEVNVNFTLFLHNKESDNFLCKRGRIRRFHDGNQEWGFPKFISKKAFEDATNGYLVSDICLFGAEVFVINNQCLIETVSLSKVRIPYKHRVTMSEFSKVKDNWQSETFIIQDQNWKLSVYPKGIGKGIGHSVSAFLDLVEGKSLCQKVKAELRIQMIDQKNSKHHSSGTSTTWFAPSASSWGYWEFARLSDVNDKAKGFVVKDSCIFEIELSVLAVAKSSAT